MREPLLYEKLNLETARIGWHELQPHFARGAVVVVAVGQDLTEVAQCMAQDDASYIADLMAAGCICAPDEHWVGHWQRERRELWAVVVAPWVLVQDAGIGDEIKSRHGND